MQRLYFKRSKNKQGKECFIAKVKNVEKVEGEKPKHNGDLIIIGNTDRCKINEAGRWDVTVRKMVNGTGYLVLEAEWTTDSMEFEIDWNENKVLFMVNGEETKLKRMATDGSGMKYFPLSFSAEDFYPIKKIVKNIREKSEFLQLGVGFNLDSFLGEFSRACEAIYKAHKEENKYSVPNTPMAEALQKLK